MPAEIQPPELARVVDFAERPRQGDWSLRSALVRYAEGQPERVSRVLEQVRRVDSALHHHRKLLDRRGHELWTTLDGDTEPDRGDTAAVDLLRVASELDHLGEIMAVWADDRMGPRPDDAVDAATAAAAERLDDLGVPREEPPPRRSGRG